MRLILLGAPGSGKGTQADLMKEFYKVEKLSTGDLLRNEIKMGTDLGQEAQTYMNAGELVPDKIMLGIIEHKAEMFKEKDTGFILDGFPRTLAQARGLKDSLHRIGMDLDAALHIDVPEPELIRRLSSRWTCRSCQGIFSYPDDRPENTPCSQCGGQLYQRDDDKKDTVLRRMNVYIDKTLPLLTFYRQEGLYRAVDGQGQIQEIFSRIKSALNDAL